MEKTDEIWTDIPGFPNYQISSYGRVYNLKFKRLLSPSIQKASGRKRVILSDEYGRKDMYIHRLVAQAFMPDFKEGLQIEFIDGDRTNNHVSNLKARGGNALAVVRYEANHIRGGKVRVLETGQIFLNAYSAARHFNTDASTIYKVLRGERKRHLGMRFEVYREENHYEN